jgi:hypothetical protein
VNPAWIVLLSVRKLFGFLIPGFVWLVLLSVWQPALVERLLTRVQGIWSHAGFVIPVAIIASYFVGAISSVIAFRFLELAGDALDWLLSHITLRPILALIRALSRRLHILSVTTLDQDLRLLEQMAPSDDFAIRVASQTGNLRWGLWKMYALERSPALAKEALDLEGEINFMAGMFGPAVGVAVWSFGHAAPTLAWALAGVAAYLGLRFQNLRHHELWFVAQAYGVSRQIAAERPTSPKG